MPGSAILDVTIGVILVFVLVSIVCTAVREAIEAAVKSRASHLELAIRQLFQDETGERLTRSVYEHPLIYGLYAGEYEPRTRGLEERAGAFTSGGDLPSYIPSRNFAGALLDIAARGPDTADWNSGSGVEPLSVESVRRNIMNVDSAVVRRAILVALDEGRGDLEAARTALAAWYDSAMDRVSGHYKRASQRVILAIAFGIAVLMNVDTIRVARFLYADNAARSAMVERARHATGAPELLERSYAETGAALLALELPIGYTPRPQPGSAAAPLRPAGWSSEHGNWLNNAAWYVALSLPGWLLTALAAMLGAPFWFDVLNKVMVIRATVKPREKSPEEGSEDRQPRSTHRADADVQIVAAAAPAAAAPQPPEGVAHDDANADDHMHADENAEGCGVHDDIATADSELPEARGGVAR